LKPKQLTFFLTGSGLTAIILSLLIFGLIFYPVAKVEVAYQLRQSASSPPPLSPADTDFGILIPNIAATAKIIAQVDPYTPSAYQQALTQGVAHARGTALPGQVGNVFLFSHSSANFYEASRYNSVFYLLHHLEVGDDIDLYYQGEKFTYQVSGTKIVPATAVSYLQSNSSKPTLTLMTCWPPGTTISRLLVFATLNSTPSLNPRSRK